MTTHPSVLDDAVVPPLQISLKGKRNDPLTCPSPLSSMKWWPRYVDWREDAAAVADAYTRWLTAPAHEEAQCYPASFATLDQEESAAAG